MIEAQKKDYALGMEVFLTDSPGCGGVLRSSPEDFIVEEAYLDLRYAGGRYLVLEVEKRDWDTHHLIREISRQLRISQKRIGFAGTKDKRAVTRQRMSIMNLEEGDLERVNLPGLKIRVLGGSNRAVGLGDLRGNDFRIKIRKLECPQPRSGISAVTEEISRLGGLPNYFGVQRFGESRPVTHLVGKALVRGNMEEAAFIYLALPFASELQQSRRARQLLWEKRDPALALKAFPEHLRYERAMLNHLVAHPRDYAGSFLVLPPNLRRLFVHAYQSYLFNRLLSRRLRSGLPLDRAVEGDVVCFTRAELPDVSRTQRATKDNLEAVNRLAERRRAFVTLPLLGYQSELAAGAAGGMEKEVLASEGMSLEGFKVEACPELGSPGGERAAMLRCHIDARVEDDVAELQFFLPPGSYATVVLREYMKDKTSAAAETTSADNAATAGDTIISE
jgi:tRNA pseudouridine13 synthase